jgi:PAS domain S-box-containing protein/putative nucleotidyltransferase with HDIG domain
MDELQQAAYRSLQDKDQRGIFTTDAHLHLSSWNCWLEERSGLRREDVLGRPLLKLYPKAAARLEPLYRQSLEGQVVVISPRLHPYLLPLPPVERNGEEFMRQSARIMPLYGDGGVIGTLTIIEDVSERFLREGELRQHIHQLQVENADRQKAEVSLRKSEITQKTILRAAPIGIGLVSRRIFGWTNEQFSKITGYSAEELLGQSARMLYESEAEFEWVGRFKYAAIKEKGTGSIETRWRRKDDTVMDILLSSTPLDPRNLDAGVVFTAIDITHRKEAEKELRLKEVLLDGASDSIFLHDLEGHFLYLNEAAYKDRGYGKEELLAQNLSIILTPEFAKLRESLLADLMAKGESIFESAHRRKDGSVMPVEIHARTIDLDDRQLILSVARDITERKQAEEKITELNALLKAIKEINEALLRVKSEPDLFQQTCDLLMQVPNIRFTWIGLVQPESFEIKPAAWAGYEAGYLADIRVTWDDSPHGGGAIGIAIKTGQPVVMEDIVDDPRALPWREAALKRGYSNMMALPLVHGDLIIGALNVYSEKQNVFREDEIEFLQQVAGDIAVGVRSLRYEQEMVQSLIKLQIMMIQTIEAIASMAELRDPYTAGHQQRVTRLALALAQEVGLAPDRAEGLRVASLIHDIGKIVVPAEILSRPGKISDMEMNLIKAHSQAGYDILGKIAFPWPVAQILLQHHERLDGSGYPQGLKAPDILQEAKILAVADVIEAMSSHRPYRPTLGIEAALEEISQTYFRQL